jgi:hypothetical protein
MDPKFIKGTIQLTLSYILEDVQHIKIENTYGHENTRESSWNPNTLDPDRPQQDCPTAYVIAQ